MSIYFKTIRSSSSGNCIAVWTDHTRILFDCGLTSMKQTRAILKEDFCNPEDIDAVIISHLHGDHISYYPLKVLEDCGTTVKVHGNCLKKLKTKHFNGYGFKSLRLEAYTKKFEIGDMVIEPFKVPHHPEYLTHGFVIRYQHGKKWKKAVLVTDFNNGRGVVRHFKNADFIFVESNHDLELLDMYFNPNSMYHMSNPKTAELLCMARKQSKKAPQAVVLGHISFQRNDVKIALKETRSVFKKDNVKLDFSLCAAPLYKSSQVVKV
jgi:phosphoribosyl 1,2-cyclic phosphodiesterase